jgi:hypothetical protein
VHRLAMKRRVTKNTAGSWLVGGLVLSGIAAGGYLAVRWLRARGSTTATRASGYAILGWDTSGRVVLRDVGRVPPSVDAPGWLDTRVRSLPTEPNKAWAYCDASISYPGVSWSGFVPSGGEAAVRLACRAAQE